MGYFSSARSAQREFLGCGLLLQRLAHVRATGEVLLLEHYAQRACGGVVVAGPLTRGVHRNESLYVQVQSEGERPMGERRDARGLVVPSVLQR